MEKLGKFSWLLFLDALDELKLREGTLRKALKKLQDAVEPHFGRVNVILSCRPADWKTTIDQQSLKAFCVSGNESRPEVIADPEAAFLAVVSREEANAEEKTRRKRNSVVLIEVKSISFPYYR